MATNWSAIETCRISKIFSVYRSPKKMSFNEVSITFKCHYGYEHMGCLDEVKEEFVQQFCVTVPPFKNAKP